MENAITLRNVTKKFYNKEAPSLNNISLDIHTGQVVGIFGKVGDVYIFNKPLSKDTRRFISYLGEDYVFFKSNSVKSIVNFYADFYKDFNQIIMTSLLSKFNISPESLYQDLSSKNKKILMLCLTLSRETKIYLLDEPLKGEDLPIDVREFIFSTIFETCSKNSLIIITSSLVEDIEDSCDSVIFLDNGKLLLDADIITSGRSLEKKNLDKKMMDAFEEICRRID